MNAKKKAKPAAKKPLAKPVEAQVKTWEAYLKSGKGTALSEKTVDRYLTDLRAVLEYLDLGNVREMTAGKLWEYRAWLRTEKVNPLTGETGYSDNTLRNHVQAAKFFFAFLTDKPMGILARDPLKTAEVPTIEEPDEWPTFTEEEYQKMLEQCEGNKRGNVRDTALLTLLWTTGLRREEALKIVELDFEEGTCKVADGKTGPRVVHFDEDTSFVLQRYMNHKGWQIDGPPYFRSEKGGGALGTSGVNQIVKRLSKAAGVARRGLGPHGLRRAWSGKWLEDGGSETALITEAGWSESTGIAMIRRYSKSKRQELAAQEARRLFELRKAKK